jgi:hypothetical protein
VHPASSSVDRIDPDPPVASASKRPRRAGWFALAALASGCVTSAAPKQAPLDAPLAVAAGGDSYFLCLRDRVELRTEKEVEAKFDVAPATGDPSAMAIDVERGWAGVAYPGRLALIALTDRRLTWSKETLPEAPVALAVANDRVAALTTHDVALYRLPDGSLESRTDLRPWMRDFKFDSVRYVLPRADQRLIVVGFQDMTFAGNSHVVLQRVDASRGAWKHEQSVQIEGITWIHACASEGRSLWIAGTLEFCRDPATGGGSVAGPASGAPRSAQSPRSVQRGDLLLTLVVQRVDPETLRAEELIHDEQFSRDVSVRQLVVGDELLAIVFEDGEVRVYPLSKDGGVCGRALYDYDFSNLGPGVAAAWLGPTQVVVSGRGGSKVVSVR